MLLHVLHHFLSEVLWFALLAIGSALLLPAVGSALLPSVGFALLGSSHHRSRSSCSSGCPRTLVALVRASYHWLVGCGSACASSSKSLCGRLRLCGSFRPTGRKFTTTCSASVVSGLKKFVASAGLSSRPLVTAWVHWFFQRWVVIDPRFTFSRLALTENLGHFHSLLLLTCSDDSFWSSSRASQCHSHCGRLRLRVLFLMLLSCIARGSDPRFRIVRDLVFLLDDVSSLIAAQSFC